MSAEPVTIRPFDESLPMALLRAREAAMRLFRPMLADHDLTEQQWRVLRALSSEGSLEVGRLAEATFLLGPSLSRILAKLEQNGLVERRSVPHDQRRSSMALTTAGSEMVSAVAPRSEALYTQIEDRVGADTLDDLFALLARLEQLDDVRAPSGPERLARAS